jgi:hypothetical protein
LLLVDQVFISSNKPSFSNNPKLLTQKITPSKRKYQVP